MAARVAARSSSSARRISAGSQTATFVCGCSSHTTRKPENMKEMPATLLLRPLGLDTLAVAVWEKTSESLWAEAAVPALAIVAAGLAPVLVVIRLSSRRD